MRLPQIEVGGQLLSTSIFANLPFLCALREKIDNCINTIANQILDDDCYCGGNMDWQEAYDRALEQLEYNFDKVDENYELIEINKEDDPDLWHYYKQICNQIIINYQLL